MGAVYSALHNDLSPSSCFGDRNLLNPGLGDLPEGCVALIVENLDPVEICSFSKLNRAFRGASWADFVWESKLPPNYRIIIEKLLGGFPENLRKRDIFAFLSRINSFDEATKVRLSSHPFDFIEKFRVLREIIIGFLIFSSVILYPWFKSKIYQLVWYQFALLSKTYVIAYDSAEGVDR